MIGSLPAIQGFLFFGPDPVDLSGVKSGVKSGGGPA